MVPLTVSHLVDFADSAHVVVRAASGDTTPKALGLQSFAEHVMTVDGAPAIMLTRHSETRGVLFNDTLVMRRTGLEPIWEHMRSGKAFKDIEYTGDRVHQLTYVGDSLARTIDKQFARPPFGFNQLDMVVRSLPLRPGFRTTLPLYSEGDDSVEVDTVSVLAVKDGPPVQWVVRFADPVIIATYGIDTVKRRVVTYEVSNRASGAKFWHVH